MTLLLLEKHSVSGWRRFPPRQLASPPGYCWVPLAWGLGGFTRLIAIRDEQQIWPGFTERAAIASMITGFSVTMISKFILQELDAVGVYFIGLETMPPSFFSALVVGYVVAILWPDKKLAQTYAQELLSIEGTPNANGLTD